MLTHCDDCDRTYKNIKRHKQTKKHQKNELTSKLPVCCICSEGISEDLETTKCNHQFHKKCLSEWNKYKQNCPLCRTRIHGSVSFPENAKVIVSGLVYTNFSRLYEGIGILNMEQVISSNDTNGTIRYSTTVIPKSENELRIFLDTVAGIIGTESTVASILIDTRIKRLYF